jgi:hypothetical protein
MNKPIATAHPLNEAMVLGVFEETVIVPRGDTRAIKHQAQAYVLDHSL